MSTEGRRPRGPLSADELERYSRQLDLPGWSAGVQERLRRASAILVGAGALGAPAGGYLAAAGVGRIGVVDSEPVELSGLHRQILHFTPEVGANRAESAALKLGILNPEVQAEPYPVRLEEANAAAIVAGADVVLDCSNRPDTSRPLSDACCQERVPFVAGGVDGLEGFLTSSRPGESACYRCAFPEPTHAAPAASDGRGGALGAVAGIVGSAQALEAIKLLTGVGRPLLDHVLWLDGGDMSQRVDAVARRPECRACAGLEPPQQSR